MNSAHVRLVTLRIAAPVLFGIGGACLILLTAVLAPSFWYLPCFYILPVVAGFWAWRPRVGAALSIGPLISIAVLLHYLSGVWLAIVLVGFLTALVCVGIAAKESGSFAIPLALPANQRALLLVEPEGEGNSMSGLAIMR